MVIQGMIKESDIYRQNADNCMQLAEAAQDEARNVSTIVRQSCLVFRLERSIDGLAD
jgi:hypothetical protein